MPDSTLATLDNTAIKIERALYPLFTSLTGDAYKSIYAKLPDVIKTTILPKLGEIIQNVKAIVNQFLDGDLLNKILSVLESGLALVNSTLDMLPDAVQNVADKAARFLAIVVDFAHAGIEHLRAIVDLLLKAAQSLVDDPTKAGYVAPTLLPATVITLQSGGIIPAP
jgi:hypothetical protein